MVKTDRTATRPGGYEGRKDFIMWEACAEYADGTSAAVAYDGTDYKAFTMGFPIECIREKNQRESIMRGIMGFLLP